MRSPPPPQLLLAASWVMGISAIVTCGGAAPDDEAVAYVGETPVAYEDFLDFVEDEAGDAGADLDSTVLSALFDRFLLEEQLRRLAIDRRLVSENNSRRAALAALLSEEGEAEASREELETYYRDHAEEFVFPARVRLRQILVEDRTTAEEAIAALASGEPFAAVAEQLSIDPSAPLGGDQGELGRQDLPPGFADAIFALAPGEVSGILEAAYGFHLFQVVEHLPAETISLAEAEATVRAILGTRVADRRRSRIEEEARRRYNVRIERRKLPFSYRDETAGGTPGETGPEEE